ncbi:MAG: DUF5683 domain-containing protein [Fibromonadales bacterium]|nr:DUF5683 domain-containing protein [Fibromonadales bacterium]
MRFFLILFLITLAFAQEQEQKSEADKRAELLGTVNVSRVHSLDNAKGTYKSPRRAMFMSLIVPGSGQFYVGGQPRYIRGTFYLAEEIALITGLYYHSVYKYDKQVKKYQNFAKIHFDIGRYEEAMNSISVYEDANREIFQINYGSERENYCKAAYGPSAGGSDSKCVSFIYGYDFYEKNKGRPLYDPSAFYRTIASEDFILGWEDVIPNSLAEADINSGKFVWLGTSENRKEYVSMRKKATAFADRQAIFFGAILLNHIISAIDAALSAKAHNNSLYEEKISFLDKIRLNSNFTAGENFRAETNLMYLF